jgi:hypothetical protein
MMTKPQTRALSLLGTLLIICALIAIAVIGSKAKALLFYSAILGAAAWIIAYLNSTNKISDWAGVGFSLACAVLYGQRALANLLVLIGIIQNNVKLFDAYNKSIMFIMLLLMSIISVSSLMVIFSNIIPESETTRYGSNKNKD